MINDCLPLVKILYVRVHPEARKVKEGVVSTASPTVLPPVSSSFPAGKFQKGGAL